LAVLTGGALAMAGAAAQAKVEGDTIILGSAISFTGKYSTNGVHAQKGYDLAIERINAMGGVEVNGKSYKLAVQYYDDESTPARGAQLAERLINQDGVKFILGPYSSGLTKAIAPVTEKYKIPMVEAEGASRSLFTQGYRYLFAVLSTSEQYLASSIDLAAEIAQQNGKQPSDVRIAMAFENDPFSLDVRQGVVDDAERYGMQIVIDDKLPRDLSDMSATLTKVRALKPDLLVVSGHSKGAATAARQLAELKIDTPMVAMTHCEAAAIVSKFGASTEGILCPTQWAETLSYEDGYFGTAAEFDAAFKERYPALSGIPGNRRSLSVRPGRRRRPRVEGGLRACPVLRYGGVARCAGHDRHEHFLWRHQVLGGGQQHRQADGASSGARRRAERGGALQMGVPPGKSSAHGAVMF
jgi:branched-chain amino acid transport system substrate-binding protein